MDFQLTSEQTLFQDSIRRTLADFGESASGEKLRATLAELGVLAVQFPEDLGGLGASAVETVLIMTEFGRSLVAHPYIPSVVHAGTVLSTLGLAPDLVEGLIDGSHLTVMAAGPVTARRVADGGYVLDGKVPVVIGGSEADNFLVTATSSDGAFDGIGLFRLTASDVAVTGYRTIDGFGAADVRFDAVALPGDALLSADCSQALDKAEDAAILALAAETLGAMEAAFWLTNDYLKTRKQFGVAIGSFQALQHRMADRYVDLEQCRSMVYRGISASEAPAEERRRTMAAVKAYVGRLGRTLSADMVQLHGGIGVSEEHLVGHYYRRLLANELRYGCSDIHYQRIVDFE